MGFFDVGQYMVGNGPNGFYLYWKDEGGRHQIEIHLENMLHEYVESNIQEIIILINRFEDHTLHTEDSEYNVGRLILDNLSEGEVYPPSNLSDIQLRDWFRQSLITGYNRVYGTQFTLSMIQNRF